jgi:hypothetical protein
MSSIKPSEQSHHAGSRSNITDIEEIIEKSSCGDFYMALENCLVETDRNWRKCQNEVM